MKERILEYRKRIDRILEEGSDKTDWQEVMDEHLVQVAFFQHERLIHLIVTVLFALMTIISVSAYVISGEIYMLALIGLLLVLLIPYIGHYYLLENETQKMYGQYDKILKHINKKDEGEWDRDD